MSKRYTINLIICLIIMWSISSVSIAQVMPFAPYRAYEYNSYRESVPAPVGFVPTAIFTGQTMGVDDLNNPRDMFYADNGKIYILDSGNGRILILDKTFKHIETISSVLHNGEELFFQDAQGLYVYKDDIIYLADTVNKRLLVFGHDRQVVDIFYKPESELIPDEKEFNIMKVLRDDNDIIYTIINGINEGAVTFDSKGNFKGFYGSNQVQRTAQVLLDFFWQKFMTKEQIERTRSRMPSEITNFDIDARGFIYTVTSTTRYEGNLRRLNFKGINLIESRRYGDFEWDRKLKEQNFTRFIDVSVSEDNYISLIDSTRNRIFQYSYEGDLIAIFGGEGYSAGTFKSPVAVESIDDKVYVLDSVQNNITEFSATDYVIAMKTALDYFDRGLYIESLDYWAKVLEFNSNSELANYGIGRAYDEAGDYAKSLTHFKLSFNQRSYSDAFKEVRKEFVRDNFTLLVFVLITAIAVMILLVKFLKDKYKRKSEYDKSIFEKKYVFPLYTAIHPIDGFDQLKSKSLGSYKVSLFILFAFFTGLFSSFFLTGFIFNPYRASDFNILITLAQAFGVIAVWTVANWLICTLFEGKGRAKDVFTMTSYALVPYIVSIYIQTILSNFLVLDESSFIMFAGYFGIIWSTVLILIGLSKVHQFTLKKTLLSIAGTFFALAVIIFLAIMFFGLMRQLYSFAQSIYSEIQLIMVS